MMPLLPIPRKPTVRNMMKWAADNGVEFDIKADPETDITPHESLAYPGSDVDADAIVERAEFNVWEWCMVTVRARHTASGLEAREYLGGCSYASEKDFCKAGGYYVQMLNEAAHGLILEVSRVRAALEVEPEWTRAGWEALEESGAIAPMAEWQTGGGCLAYGVAFSDGTTCLITHAGDAMLPHDNMPSAIGFYDTENNPIMPDGTAEATGMDGTEEHTGSPAVQCASLKKAIVAYCVRHGVTIK